MTSIEYEIFYDYTGPSADAPLRTPLSRDDIQLALQRFANDLQYRLSDSEAIISTEPLLGYDSALLISIRSALPESDIKLAVAESCRSFDLFGRRRPSSLP